MPSTGQTCETSGIYRPSCGCKEIALSKGETFPPCAGKHQGITWTLVRPTQ